MMIDNAFIAAKANSSIPLNSLSTTIYPATSEEIELAKASARNSILKYISGVFITLAFSVTYVVLISDLVTEKETKIREAMKVLIL